jgi:hypothetical protein
VLARNDHYGVVTQILGKEHGDMVAELGVGSVRLDFNWDEIEAQPGRLDWRALDDRISEARAQNLEVLATMAYTPAWAGPARNRLPDDLADWQNFVRACMRRYGEHVVYGVWNEPNLDQFLEDDDSGGQYQKLWNAAHEARLEVDGNLSLAGPETSHHAMKRYYQRVMDAMNGRGQMLGHDKVTVHWYPDGPRLGGYMKKVRGKAGGREVWLSETGVGTCDDQRQVDRYDAILTEFVRSGRTWWTKVFFYVLHNGESCSEAIVRPDWAPRPAFDHYRQFIAENP